MFIMKKRSSNYRVIISNSYLAVSAGVGCVSVFKLQLPCSKCRGRLC